jgi:hypothetical protein
MCIALTQLFAERFVKTKGGLVVGAGCDKVTRDAFNFSEAIVRVCLTEGLVYLFVGGEGPEVAGPRCGRVSISEGEPSETKEYSPTGPGRDGRWLRPSGCRVPGTA